MSRKIARLAKRNLVAVSYLLKSRQFHSNLRIAAARLSAFGPSKFVVGSSNARIPQLRQKVSAKANRMIRDASTWNLINKPSLYKFNYLFFQQKKKNLLFD